MRIGFIGTGGFAGEHATRLRKLGAAIAACYSTNPEKAASFAADHGATVHDDPRRFIDRRSIDALYVVVPPFANDGALAREAIAQGIPFFSEKPIGLDVAACRTVAREAQAAGLVTAVGYHLRLLPLLDETRRVLARNTISSVRSYRLGGFPKVHWWRKMAESGGMMVEQATHQVDILRHIFGEVTSVSAITTSGISAARWEGCDIYDSMEAILRFQSGIIGSIGITNVIDQGAARSTLFEVAGRDFTLSLSGAGLKYREGTAPEVEIPTPEDVDTVLEQDRQFLAAVEEGEPARVASSYADALRTLELTMAMNESARTGQTVAVH